MALTPGTNSLLMMWVINVIINRPPTTTLNEYVRRVIIFRFHQQALGYVRLGGNGRRGAQRTQ